MASTETAAAVVERPASGRVGGCRPTVRQPAAAAQTDRARHAGCAVETPSGDRANRPGIVQSLPHGDNLFSAPGVKPVGGSDDGRHLPAHLVRVPTRSAGGTA